MKLTITIREDGEDMVQFSGPGLNWNRKTEAAEVAIERAIKAVRRCQAAEHDPDYEEQSV